MLLKRNDYDGMEDAFEKRKKVRRGGRTTNRSNPVRSDAGSAVVARFFHASPDSRYELGPKSETKAG